MERSLKQNRFVTSRQVIIHDSRISYKTLKFGSEHELNIAFEDLSAYKEASVISTPTLTGVAIISLSLTILCFFIRNDKDVDTTAWLFWLAITVILAFMYFVSREVVWKVKFHNFSYIYLNKSNPNEKSVNEFIDLLFDVRKRYLRQTYFYISKNMSYESQLNNLQWLVRQEAINNDEFEEMREKLSTLFNSESRSIGFYNN